MYWNYVRERFFHCLSKTMRTNLRTQFDSGANYYKLLELARMIESENCHEDYKPEAKPTNQKGKAKVGAVTVDNTAQQIPQLQGAVKGLTKLLQGNRQNTQPQQIPQFVPNLNVDNSLPQILKTKALPIRNVVEVVIEVEVVEKEVDGEEVQFYAIGVETSYLKNRLLRK